MSVTVIISTSDGGQLAYKALDKVLSNKIPKVIINNPVFCVGHQDIILKVSLLTGLQLKIATPTRTRLSGLVYKYQITVY